jgi:hypothetical protein
MSLTCEYCHSLYEDDALKCPNCAAPINDGEPFDMRFCPYCKKKLLAIGSPACNYCGKKLPSSFIKAHKVSQEKIIKLDEESKVSAEVTLAGIYNGKNEHKSESVPEKLLDSLVDFLLK